MSSSSLSGHFEESDKKHVATKKTKKIKKKTKKYSARRSHILGENSEGEHDNLPDAGSRQCSKSIKRKGIERYEDSQCKKKANWYNYHKHDRIFFYCKDHVVKSAKCLPGPKSERNPKYKYKSCIHKGINPCKEINELSNDVKNIVMKNCVKTKQMNDSRNENGKVIISNFIENQKIVIKEGYTLCPIGQYINININDNKECGDPRIKNYWNYEYWMDIYDIINVTDMGFSKKNNNMCVVRRMKDNDCIYLSGSTKKYTKTFWFNDFESFRTRVKSNMSFKRMVKALDQGFNLQLICESYDCISESYDLETIRQIINDEDDTRIITTAHLIYAFLKWGIDVKLQN